MEDNSLLGDYVDLVTGFPFKSRDYIDGIDGIRLLRGDNIGQGYLRWRSVKRFPDKLDGAHENYALRVGDVVIAMDRPWIEAGLKYSVVKARDVPSLLVQRVARLRAKRGLSQEFLPYLIGGQNFVNHVLSVQTGTGIPHISADQIRSFKFDLLPVGEQNSIAEVLGALDRKISVNGRIAEVPRDLVRASFGRLFGSSGGRSVPLEEIASINARRASPESGGSLRYIDIASVSDGSYFWPESISWDNAPGRARRSVAKGDVIWSTVRPNRESHALVLDDDPRLVASTGFAVISPRCVGSAYLFAATSQRSFVNYLVGVAEGSAYPVAHADRFAEAPVILTDEMSVRAFEAWAGPVLSRSHEAAVENRTLTELRDTLLPKLISGQIRIKDAERAVEEAV